MGPVVLDTGFGVPVVKRVRLVDLAKPTGL